MACCPNVLYHGLGKVLIPNWKGSDLMENENLREKDTLPEQIPLDAKVYDFWLNDKDEEYETRYRHLFNKENEIVEAE